MRGALAGFAAVLLAASPARAAFETIPYSPRAAALSNAMTALSDDPVTGLYNPATLGALDDYAVGMGYSRQFKVPAGVANQDVFALTSAVPVRQEIFDGTFGFSGVFNRQQERSSETAWRLAYGTHGFKARDQYKFELGGAMKFLRRGEAGSTSKLGAALDVGGLMSWRERYAMGLSILNLNRPKVTGDRAAAEVRLGFSDTTAGFSWSFDLAKREGSKTGPGGTAEAAMGIERWWATSRSGSFAGRGGLSMGDKHKSGSVGLGWKIHGAQVDYAVVIPITGITVFGHSIGLSYKFGQKGPEAEYEKVLAGEMKYRRDLTATLQAAEVKQIQLAEELSRLRSEIESLRRRLSDKTASETETKAKLREVEGKHRTAVETFERMKADAQKTKAKTQQDFLNEDWGAYQRLKLSGAADSALVEQLERILRQYKDTGLDLSSVNQELVRLLKAR